MAARKKPYKIVCTKTNFDNGVLWHEGDEAFNVDVSEAALAAYFRKVGGSPEDLVSAVDEEKESTGTKNTASTKEK